MAERISPFLPPPSFDTEDAVAELRTSAMRAVAFLVGVPALLVLFSLPLVLTAGDWRQERIWQYVVGLVTLWIAAATAGVVARRERLSQLRDWFGRPTILDMAVAIGLLLAGTAAMYLFSEGTDNPRVWHLPVTGAEKGLWLLLCLTVGFCEEIVYRGYCLTRLIAATRSPTAAWLIQGALYGSLHFAFGPVWMGFTVGVGLFLGWLVLWRKSLWPAIIVHVLADAAVLIGGH
jgi:membrane protease YdiL (CAAX protease family)